MTEEQERAIAQARFQWREDSEAADRKLQTELAEKTPQELFDRAREIARMRRDRERQRHGLDNQIEFLQANRMLLDHQVGCMGQMERRLLDRAVCPRDEEAE